MLTSNPKTPPQPFVPSCPVCGSITVQVYDRNERRLFACNNCQTDVIVPISAWTIATERKSDNRES